MATKVVFDTGKRARGVEVETAGKPFFVEAKQEVILSAGSFQSPQLLMSVSSFNTGRYIAEQDPGYPA